MKFKFKFGNFFLFLGTALAIILSIVLWIFIMTNDQRFSHIDQQRSSSVDKEQLRNRNTKDLYDLYIPTNSYGFKNGKVYRLYDSKNNLPFEFSKDLKRAKVDNVSSEKSNQSSYEQLLNNPNFIQLTYPDEITLKLFGDYSRGKSNREFNRIFIPSSNKWIYLGDDETNQLYRVTLKNGNFDRLRKYAKDASYNDQVEFVRLKSGYSTFYSKEIDWKVYSYLTNHQSDSYFVNRLLGTSGVSSRTSKDGQTTYSLNYSNRLRVPKAGKNPEHNYLYTSYEKGKIPSTTNRLLDSVYYVHNLGLTEQDLRFFDADNNSVSYTNYIEGTPVFLNQHDVQVNTTFSTGAVSIAFNSINFQIPIPFDGQTEKLESTGQMIKNLQNHGINKDDIEKVLVGFRVEKDNSHDSLINLIPTYYVKAYGEWKSAGEWSKQDMSVYKTAKTEGVTK
ncbi:hypothetical protein GCM10022297_06610 [Lactobacillus hamsteri]